MTSHVLEGLILTSLENKGLENYKCQQGLRIYVTENYQLDCLSLKFK